MHDCIVIFHRCALLDVAKGLLSTVSEHTYFNCESEFHTVVPCQVFNAIYINKCLDIGKSFEILRNNEKEPCASAESS